MYYIWTDESDSYGKYYANFYGGILIQSKDYEEVLSRLQAVVESVGLSGEEIKWQKVNAYTEERYMKIIDELFEILGEGKAKIRIFFRHRRHEAAELTNEQRRKEYQMLYYQFIKHAFGIRYSNPTGVPVRLRLFLDDMPLKKLDRQEFLDAIYNLNTTVGFTTANIRIAEGDVAEVNSKSHLPLQVMDLVLGSMCFRLNDKHLIKDIDGKRARRTIIKERLYKYIRAKICKLHPGFNVGTNTGITKLSDRWEQPYRHWSFVPNNSVVNEDVPKKHQQKNSPGQPT
jgi:hypothetical protein